jgi:hypothetical protein
MPEYNFTLVISGPVDEKLDELYEAGCDDALIGAVDGVHYAEFDREAPSLREAIGSAIQAVASIDGLTVDRVEPEDFVTAAEIAERLGRSRESVRLLIAGERGPGGFPAPISHLRDRNRLWRWTEVAAWAGVGQLSKEEIYDAVFIAAMNATLEVIRRRSQLGPDELKLLELIAA